MSEYDFEKQEINEEQGKDQSATEQSTPKEDTHIENKEKNPNQPPSEKDNIDEGILEFMNEVSSSGEKALEIEAGVEEFMHILGKGTYPIEGLQGIQKQEQKEKSTVEADQSAGNITPPPGVESDDEDMKDAIQTSKPSENAPSETKEVVRKSMSPPHSLSALLGSYGDGSDDEEDDDDLADDKEEGSVANPSEQPEGIRHEAISANEGGESQDSVSAKAAALSAKAAAVDEKFAALLSNAKKSAQKNPASAPPESSENLKKAAAQNDALPEGWEAHWDEEENRYYYFNQITHESTWEVPQTPPQAQKGEEDKEQISEIEAVQAKSVLLFSPAGDLWKGHQISGLFEGCGARQFRSLGQGYYMMSFSSKDITARAIAMAAEDGVSALENARHEWTKCKRDVFIRYVTGEDPPELLDLPTEDFDDPKHSTSQVISKGPTTVARAPALYKTEVVYNPPVLSKTLTAQTSSSMPENVDSSSEISEEPPGTTSEVPSKPNGGVKKKSTSSRSGKKKGKIDTSLIDKWKKVAKKEGRASDPVLERKRKLAEWQKSMVTSGEAEDNPNFAPVGGGIPGGGEKMFRKETSARGGRKKSVRSKKSY